MFKNLFSFEGRIRRTEYGLTVLGYMVVYFILMFASGAMSGGSSGSPMVMLLLLPVFFIMIAQAAKRCHDRGNSGWWQLIPFYGLWLLFADGEPYDNEYGPDPKGRGGSGLGIGMSRPDVLDSPMN